MIKNNILYFDPSENTIEMHYPYYDISNFGNHHDEDEGANDEQKLNF